MRRLWAAGAAVVLCLALGGVQAAAQTQDPTGVRVTVAQECAGRNICIWTASDPRLPDTLTTDMFTGSVEVEGAGFFDAGFAWMDQSSEGPEGGWTGYVYALWGEPTQNFLVLSGTGANEGWQYIASGTDPDTDGDFEWIGTLYEGELPPFPHPVELPTPAEDPTEAPAAETIGEPADSGARIIEIEELDERLVDLTVESPAVGTEMVRLLLPAEFDPAGDAEWPVLWLLHGAFDDYTSWTRETDVADLTAEAGVLVVMPEAGEFGMYSDWYNGGEGGPPMWETFHLTEVRELLERNYQAGNEAVVAGLSMGGLGTMSYAGRHPEMFNAAAAFSGLLHILAPGLDTQLDPAVWGTVASQLEIWEEHDPVTLAPALEGMPLYVAWGDGTPGPLDAPKAELDETEAWLATMNQTFVDTLDKLGIPVTVNAYGPGTHTWPYWERELHAAMPMLLEALEP